MTHNKHDASHLSHDLVAVLQLLAVFGLTQQQQAQLLGLRVPALERALRGIPIPLSREQHDRLHLRAQIVIALLTLYDDQTAVGWFDRPNQRPPFEGQTPLAFILDGGISALRATSHVLLGDLGGQFSATPRARALARTLPQPDFELDD